ncbi:hypothetical protein [Gloeobacter violaceus]|nr:hypothetical protein [Gloeobacter violaceus]
METQTPRRAVSDLEYNLLTVLQNKAEAIKAYDVYIRDARQANSQPCAQLFEKLQQMDIECAQEIRHHLQEVMQKGRM